MKTAIKTGLLADRRFLGHRPGPGHPERPDRLEAILQAVEVSELADRLVTVPARPAAMSDVLAVHSRQYVRRLRAACKAGAPYIDSVDSSICPDSYTVALLAAGGVVAACEAVMSGGVNNAFCAVRPPGHHCEPDRTMGFCLLNNVAIAARCLRRRHGLSRVLILDWDVHHGNGTQRVFERDGSVFFCSLHEHPSFCYPGTGFSWERGEGPGRGRILNLPMLPNTGDAEYLAVFRKRFLPAARAFRPEFILVSAGFDAHADDPLANLGLTQAAFDALARETVELARVCCGGRLVVVLEGGYNLEVLGSGSVSLLQILLGDMSPTTTSRP